MTLLTAMALLAHSSRLLRRSPTIVPRSWSARSRALCAIAASSPVQRVYELAAAGDLESARSAMDLLTAEDVGLESAQPLMRGDPICYHHVYSDSQLTISIFVLPEGAVLPLHDHPDMTVLSKLIYGSLRVTSFDMPEEAAAPPKRSVFELFEPYVARLRCGPPSRGTVTASCQTLRLDPTKGNIHQFEAVSTTAIFDILTPPYNDFAGRSCHYYEVDHVKEDGSAELVETGWPPDLHIASQQYRGQQCGPIRR